MAIMGRDPFGIIKEGEVHTISYANRHISRSNLIYRFYFDIAKFDGIHHPRYMAQIGQTLYRYRPV